MKSLIKTTILFAAGAAVGAAVALLLHPKTSEQTREQLKDLAEEAKNRAQDFAENVKTRAQECCEQVKQNMAEANAVAEPQAEAAEQPKQEA